MNSGTCTTCWFPIGKCGKCNGPICGCPHTCSKMFEELTGSELWQLYLRLRKSLNHIPLLPRYADVEMDIKGVNQDIRAELRRRKGNITVK